MDEATGAVADLAALLKGGYDVDGIEAGDEVLTVILRRDPVRVTLTLARADAEELLAKFSLRPSR